MIKKISSILLVLIWMILIFNYSSDSGEESSSLSEEVIENVVVVVTDIKRNTNEMSKIVNKYSFFVRKCAHFFLYFVLGILVINMFYSFNLSKFVIIYSAVLCILYALFDEVHQIFVDGRSGNIKDVLLDSSASLIALYLINRVFFLRGKNEKLNE